MGGRLVWLVVLIGWLVGWLVDLVFCVRVVLFGCFFVCVFALARDRERWKYNHGIDREMRRVRGDGT